MVSCIVLCFLLVRKPTIIDTGEKIAKIRLDSLSKDNNRLNKEITSLLVEKAYFRSKLDSLSNLPKEIKKQYKKEVNEIDNKNANELISGFNQLFSDAGIK